MILRYSIIGATIGFAFILSVDGLLTYTPKFLHRPISKLDSASSKDSSNVKSYSGCTLSMTNGDASMDSLSLTNNDHMSIQVSSNSSSTVWSAAALIAGTTIGGGFLALPYTTAPVGAIPAVLGLSLCWFYLLLCALDLNTATFRVASIIAAKRSPDFSEDRPISIYTIAKESYGNAASLCTGGLFLILMISTLVAQLSKVGTLLGKYITVTNRPEAAATIALSVTMSAVTFGFGSRFTESLNSFLTFGMLASFSLIIGCARGAGWSSNGLQRYDFSQLIPGKGHTWAIPVFMQLLVYAETIPMIASRLKDERKVRRSIILGSVAPLFMCILWTLVALGLTSNPQNHGAIVTAAKRIDPIDIIMQSVSISRSGISSRLLRGSVFGLSITAISTTVLGSLLAMSQFIEDLLTSSPSTPNHNNSDLLSWFRRSIGSKQKNVSRFLSIVPAALIAAFGSRNLYYYATAFAGAFPVTLLWGIFPSLACLKLDTTRREERLDTHNIRQYLLIAVGSVMLILNAIVR